MISAKASLGWIKHCLTVWLAITMAMCTTLCMLPGTCYFMELCQWHISYFYIMQLCYWHIWYFLYFMELYQGHICCFFSYVSDLLYVLYFSDKPQQEQIKSPTDGVTASSGMNYTWVEVYITFIVAKAYFICNSQSVFKKRERRWEGGIY